jgi:hypothetical protein
MDCKILRGTAAIVETNMVITLPDVGTLTNGDIGKFVIINSIDYTNPLGTVSITINGTTFPLQNKLGNSIRIEQLRTRRVYAVAVGAETPNLTLLSCVPESSYVYPTFSA